MRERFSKSDVVGGENVGLRDHASPPRSQKARRKRTSSRRGIVRFLTVSRLRFFSQGAIALLSLWIGVKFYFFVTGLERQDPASLSLRSPGVEAYLPISGLIGLKHWALTGTLNSIHPAATLFLLGAIATGLLLKKGFCGWVCPIGFLSENLMALGTRLLGRREPLRIPPLLDYPLRSIKYLLLAFFLWAILIQMDLQALAAFIDSPYNRVADIKMLKFFTDMSATTAKVLLGLLVFSLVIPNLWCRYLCPYGALLGALSWLSPSKITRNDRLCIDCGLCSRACPARLPVDRLHRVRSDECNGCLECVGSCPVPGALEMRFTRRFAVKPILFGAFVLGLFFVFPLAGRLTGHWRPAISLEEYRYHVEHLDSPVYQHNRGRVATSEPDKPETRGNAHR